MTSNTVIAERYTGRSLRTMAIKYSDPRRKPRLLRQCVDGKVAALRMMKPLARVPAR